MNGLLKRIVACAMAACLAVAYVPGLAYAGELVAQADEESTTGTLSCANGWALAYEATEAEDGWQASITGVEETGSGELVIPEEVTLDDGGTATVTALAAASFMACEELTAIELPDTLVTIGKNALRQTSLSSISIPASVAYIPVYCFWKCTLLEEVTFEGDSLEFLGFGAFNGCSALQRLEVPALLGSDYTSERYTESATTLGSYRIGLKCFYNCPALSELVLCAGGASDYFNDSLGQFDENYADLCIISYVKHDLTRTFSTQGVTVYHAVRFYASIEACEADAYGTQADYVAVYAGGTSLFSIVNDPDAVADACWASEGSMPGLASGMVWGVSDTAMTSAYSTIGNVVDVYPVAREDLDYGWVSSPEIRAAAGHADTTTVTSNQTVFRLDADGHVDLSSLQVFAADGTELDESCYEFVFLAENMPEDGSMSNRRSSFYVITPDDVWEEGGEYTVYADGTGEFADTSTGEENEYSPTGKLGIEISVACYSADVTTTTSQDRSLNLGTVELATQTALASSPQFLVVANADDAQQVLIACGLAAVGGGQAIFVDGDATDDYVYSAISGSGAGSVYVLGGRDAVGTAVMERIETIMSARAGTVSELAASTGGDEALALAAYEGIVKLAADGYDYAWGEVAVVASGTLSLASSSIASYVYQGACPVFLTGADGTLSQQALADLAAGGFSKVVVAGPQSHVPASTLDAITSATGLAVERLASASSAYECSLEVLQACEAAYAGAAGNRVVIASALDASYVAAGAQYAASTGAEFVAVACSADVKAACARYGESYGDGMDCIYVLGDFTDIDAALAASGTAGTAALFETLWDEDFTTPAVAAGDTAEEEGVLYELGTGGTANCVGLLEGALASLSISSFTYADVTYSVAKVAASAFAGNTALASVTLQVQSVGASAFKKCTNLKTLSVSATSLGASAFQGCTALASAQLSVTSIGTSAFQACTALASAQLDVSSIGTSAFRGCKKLASISTAASTVKASAFRGCAALTKVTLSSKTLVTLGVSAFQGCGKLATVKLSSTSLKTIGARAFQGCGKLTSVTLATKKLATLGAHAFQGCRKLPSLTLKGTSLKTLGARAFSGCKKLSSLTLKSTKLAKVGAGAFRGCTALKTLKVNSPVLKTIGSKAFYNCSKLQKLTLKSKKVRRVGAKAFKGVRKKVTVKVPAAKRAAYKRAFRKKGLSGKATFKNV